MDSISFFAFDKVMWVSKVPNYDVIPGLFRALHSHNPLQYSHIVGLSSHFYAHIWAGPKGLSSTYEQAHVDLDL